MLRRLAQHSALLILLLCIATAAPVLADDNVLETSIFRLEFPLGWKEEGRSTPLKVRGPNSEVLLISVAMPAPDDTKAGRMADTKQMAQFWSAPPRNGV